MSQCFILVKKTKAVFFVVKTTFQKQFLFSFSCSLKFRQFFEVFDLFSFVWNLLMFGVFFFMSVFLLLISQCALSDASTKLLFF